MKRLIMGIVLVVGAMGYTNALELSFAESDRIEKIGNNKLFTKIEDKNFNKRILLKFYSTPKLTSVFGIKTDDINVLGGVSRL